MSDPVLVVVTGMPASGKTTLARELAVRLELPLVEKDAVKEVLYETLGVGDVEWSRRLGGATYPLIFLFAARCLVAGRSVIAEGNFFRGDQERHFRALPPHRAVQIHCHAPLEVLLERYEARPDRHLGHLDRSRAGELVERFESGKNGPLAIDSELIELDTSEPVDVDRLAGRVTMLIDDRTGA